MSYVTILFSDIKRMHLIIANPYRLDCANYSSKIVGFFMPNGSFYADFVVDDYDEYQIVSWLNGGSRE